MKIHNHEWMSEFDYVLFDLCSVVIPVMFLVWTCNVPCLKASFNMAPLLTITPEYHIYLDFSHFLWIHGDLVHS